MSKELLNKGQTPESLEPGEDQIEIGTGLFSEEDEQGPDINRDPDDSDILAEEEVEVEDLDLSDINRSLTGGILSEEFDFDGDGY